MGPLSVEVAHRSFEHALGGVGTLDERHEVRQAEIDDDGLHPLEVVESACKEASEKS